MTAWRVALMSMFPPIVTALADATRAAGHEPVCVVHARTFVEGVPLPEQAAAFVQSHVTEDPSDLDVVAVARRAHVARALAAFEPDLALASFFPWKLPPEALRVPRLGIVNGHGAWLPDYRGPVAHSWAIRNGEDELGFTWHLMDEDLDTGPILARTSVPLDLDDDDTVSAIGRWIETFPALLAEVFAKLGRGERGEPQKGGTWYSFFDEDYLQLDWSRPARDIHRQVCAWRFGMTRDGTRGPLTELDGERVRVVRTRLEPIDGARAMQTGDGKLWILETAPA